MHRSRLIWRRLAFKGIFAVIGLTLFTAQVSYKFYSSASMPPFRHPAKHSGYSGHGLMAPRSATFSLSLDKRFDLKPAFALLTPIFHLPHFKAAVCILVCLPDGKPQIGETASIYLRGPPAILGFS